MKTFKSEEKIIDDKDAFEKQPDVRKEIVFSRTSRFTFIRMTYERGGNQMIFPATWTDDVFVKRRLLPMPPLGWPTTTSASFRRSGKSNL